MKSQTPYKRVDRVSDVLRQIVSQTLMTRVHHAGIENVTITDVSVTPDLRQARVYFSILDVSKINDVKKMLNASKHVVQKAIGDQMRTRNTPVVRFIFDESVEYGSKMDLLLDKIKSDKPASEEE
jgi:ribosome-binding factor A